MKKFLPILVAFFSTFLLADVPTMRMQVDRTKIYLGESVVATVSVNGSSSESPRPAFPEAGKAAIEYLGSQNRSHSSVTIINGKVSREAFEGRSFVFRITPSAAGVYRTGDLVLDLPSGRIECGGAAINVVGVEPRADIEASIACVDTAVLVDSQFRIGVTVSLRALPPPFEAYEPVLPQSPLHLQADFLDFQEKDGLKVPSADSTIGGFVARENTPGFTINNYARSGMFDMSSFGFGSDPFERRPIVFRLPPEKEERGGTNWWKYAFTLDYTPTSEGDYTFGPLTVKGKLVIGATPDGAARTEEVFVVGPAVTVRVVPPPEEGRPEWFNGGVGRSLSVKASIDASKCKVGDPLSLSLDMTGDISAGNLRPPVLNLQPGMSTDFRIYDDSVESETIEGGKRFRYRLRPLKAGTLEIPAILTAYYDTVGAKYVTVSSDPIPVQVEATTQIATGAAPAGSEDEDPPPEGIIDSAEGPSIAPLPFAFSSAAARHGIGPAFPLSNLAWFWLAPVLCGLLYSVRAIAVMARHHRERTRFGRLAAAELRRFRKAGERLGRGRDGAVADAASALRAFTAASLSLPSKSLTGREAFVEMRKRGVDAGFAERYCEIFGSLDDFLYGGSSEHAAVPSSESLDELARLMERLPVELELAKGRGEADSGWRTLATLLAFALLSATAAYGGVFERQPLPFDWERAQNSMATASTPEEFSKSAELYYAMATNGAATGALFHNLGTALLLADKPRAAAESFDVAARWLGMSPEVLGNRIAAERKLNGSPQLPPERYFLIWHHGLPLQTRCALALICWNVIWVVLSVFAILPGSSRHRGPMVKAISGCLRVVIAVAVAAGLLFAGSVAVTCSRIRGGDDIETIGRAMASPVVEAVEEEVAP